MVCDNCSTLLRDLRNGINAWKLSPGWKRGQPSLPFGDYVCIYQHYANMGDLRASIPACEVCRYLSACSTAAQDAADETKITLNIYRSDIEISDFSGILHLRGGEPTDPVSEIEGFHVALQIYSPIGRQVVDPFVLTFRGRGMGVGLAEGSTTALSLGRSIVRSPQSLEADIDSLVGLIQGWHQDCVDHHDSCSNTTTFVPTRVIHVGASDGSVEPRLWETTPQDQGQRYIAMSYCWGVQDPGNQNLKTTDDNLNERLKKIPLIHFPQVLQDAIRITRKLGILYIWIDALCIIQGQPSQTDWTAEAGKMAQIYSSSWLTISAASSDRCTRGMLQGRGDADVGIVVEIPSSAGEIGSIGIRCQPQTLARELLHSNISSRGWTMQERTLSCRVLHFTRRQLFWECATDIHHEDGNSEANSRGKVMPGHTHWMHRRLDSQSLSTSDREKMAIRWYQILQDYSNRDLRHSTDRLPAMAGIAREFSSYFPGHYLAGLWRAHLPANLMWCPGPDVRRSTVLHSSDLAGTQHKLPSWSWAVYSGFVRQDLVGSLVEYIEGKPNVGFLAFVEDASVNADNEDSMYLGRINYGTIKLRGKLQGLRYQNTSNGGSLYRHGEDTSVPDSPTHFSYAVGMDRDQNISRDCWGMAIAKMLGNPRDESFEDEKCEFAILVLNKPDPQQMVFERCGTAYVSGKRYLELFKGACEDLIVMQ